jgi:hypothetical protein
VNPLLLLGILGVGGYFLLSSGTAAASSAPSPGGSIPSPGVAPGVAPSPSAPGGNLPVYQTPMPGTVDQPAPPSGGQVYDPNLGGSIPISGLAPGFGGATTQGLFGRLRWDPLSARWY